MNCKAMGCNGDERDSILSNALDLHQIRPSLNWGLTWLSKLEPNRGHALWGRWHLSQALENLPAWITEQ